MDIRSLLRRRIREAAVAAGWPDAVPPEDRIVLELPREAAHGDLACPVAFSVASAARCAPDRVAERIAERFRTDDAVARVDVAGRGYLNFHFGEGVWRGLLAAIEEEGGKYGASALLSGEKFLVEFVSANPTGPLVVANARHAAFGEALCRCLEAAGAGVDREYYVNDGGTQVRNLALSMEARWREMRGEKAEIPKDGYRGEYVRELAEAARERFSDDFLARAEEDRIEELAGFGVDEMVRRQRSDLERMRVRYDRWFYEKEGLRDRGLVAEALEALKARGVVFESEGAQWFRATDYGDEKDRVVVRRDGEPTYTLPDVAYHREKFARGYTRLINVVGADHQTEMRTLRSALAALGEPVDRMEVIVVQFVNLKRGGEKVVMSKRAGVVIPLSELVDEVGADAARFFFLLRAPSSHLDFDLELAKQTTMANPVYYVQYGHARLCSLLENAASRGLARPSAASADVSLLGDPEARIVLRHLVRFPFVVEKAATGRSPHLVTHELMELAQSVHQFYTRYRVVGADTPELQAARLALMAAARQTIANGLGLLGVSAPERM